MAIRILRSFCACSAANGGKEQWASVWRCQVNGVRRRVLHVDENAGDGNNKGPAFVAIGIA